MIRHMSLCGLLFFSVNCLFNPVWRTTTGLNKDKKDNSDLFFLGLIAGFINGASSNGSAPASPAITNLHNKGIVNTGFLIGTSGTDASSVEVSIDNGTYSRATGVTNWKYQFPTGSSTWKDNSQHSIFVRARNSSGNTSSTVSITVRKGLNKDINGDGYPDLAVGGGGYNTSQGRAYLFLSSGSGSITQTSAASANTIITGEAANDVFGATITMGDVNGDGFSDLIVGAYGYNTNQGRAYVFHSTGNTGITVSAALSADTIITGEATSNGFGVAMAAGDVNGDGFTDILSGATLYNANQGRGYVFHSSGSSGITIALAASASTLLTGEAGTTVFGYATAIGDINGDGNADVIVNALGYSGNTGRVYIFHSSSSGIASMGALSADTILTGGAANDVFGLPVVPGDVNGDGYMDLVAAAGSYNTDQGRTYIFHSQGSAGIATANANTAVTIITGTGATNYLGRSFCVGDTNLDGYADLIIQGNAGAFISAYYFSSAGSSGIASANASVAIPTILNLGTYSNNNGKFCGTADLNGDGYTDVILGSMYESANAGHVRIFNSSSSGVVATDASQAFKDILGETSSLLGDAIPH